MSRKRNTFSKAVKHLKSSKIEEKLQTLNEIPTMNTSGLYDVVPGALSRTEIDKDNPTVPDYSTIDWDVDGEDGRDTSGLFDAEGNSLFVAPPGDNSYILGPMAAMYYTWAYPWTMVGYIRESDRRMVNLGRIDGKLSDWDGSSGNASSGSGTFYSYGQLTLEQAVWFRDVQKNPGATNDPATYNYRAFYPGPPSNTPDAFGRYFCITTGEPLATKDNEKEVNPIELQSSDVLAAILDRQRRGKTLSKAEKDFLKNKNDKDEAEVESMVDKLKDHWNQTWEDIKDFPNDLKDFGKDFLNMLDELTDKVPALEYSKDIADSILSNKPKDNSNTITQDDKDKLYDGLNYDNIKINDKKEPYADDNIIEDENGKVRPREKWPTDKNGNEIMGDDLKKPENKEQMNKWFKDHNEHPNNTGSVQNEKSEKEMNATAGASNPLAAAGQAQTQVYKNENGEWVFSYNDHAYHNVDSKDSGEVPGIGFINPKAWISSAVHAVSNVMHGRPGDGENTGGMEGYPSNIRGDSIRKFETKVDEMPIEFQNWFKNKINQKNSYRPIGRMISESRRANIVRDLKKPVVLPESKKKHKVKPGQRYKGKTNFQGMDKLIGDVKPQDPFKKERSAWSKDWQGYNAKLSQEKKNQVLELVGDGKHYFDYMLNDSKIKNAEEMEKFWGLNPELYSYVMGGKKYKATRKEQVRGDYLVFLTDENGEKTSMLQSDISIKLEEEHQKEMIAEYNKTAEPTPFLKDPLMKKVAKRLKNEIDYPDKPAKKGYPDEPPPKQVNGWHPEYGKKYKYDKLDPVSAVMMKRAPTGDPEIDANVKKASMKPKVEKKSSNWREELEV